MGRTFKSSPKVSQPYATIMGHYDGYRTKRLPDQQTLAGEYKRVAYTCSNMNANAVTCAKLRLYLKTSKGETTVLRKGKELYPVTESSKDWLFNQDYLAKTLRNPNVEIEEVVDHPILDLLHRVNDKCDWSMVDLFTITQLYLELCGKAYWYVPKQRNSLANKQIWVLPSQYVEPMKDNDRSAAPIDYFEYNYGGYHSNPPKYKPDEIIFFKLPNLLDPYKDGLSPLAASFDVSELNNMLVSNETGLLENGGRPDFVATPGKDGAFGYDTARRYEQEWKVRFGRGNSGGLLAMDEHMDLTPISLPPRDLAELQIAKSSKVEMANAYGIPFVLIDAEKMDRDERAAAEEHHAKHAVLPRCGRIAATLNKQLLTKYDDSGRLFLAYDDPVPENRVEKREEVVQLHVNGIISTNQARLEFGYKPLEGEEYDKPRALFDKGVEESTDKTNNRKGNDEVEGE